MKVAVAILPDGKVNTHLGRAEKVVVATIENKQIANWEEIDVPFRKNHDENDGHNHEGHGHSDDGNHHHNHEPENPSKHHGIIRDFMVEHDVDVVLSEHAGAGIQMALKDANIKLVVVDISGTAKETVQRYIEQVL